MEQHANPRSVTCLNELCHYRDELLIHWYFGLDMDLRDLGGNKVQEGSDKWDVLDVLYSGEPGEDVPRDERWVPNGKMFNALDISQGRDELERMPQWR